MNLFFFTVFGLYFLLMLLLIIGWQESFVTRAVPELEKLSFKKITVIVPFRNEADLVGQLVPDLFNQTFPSEHMEVIFVDDHSSDASAKLVYDLIRGRGNFKLLSLPAGMDGKKRAITEAVHRAKGDIIVTTDADCRVLPDWLKSIHASFDPAQGKLIFGGVRIQPDESFFSKMQALEYCSLIGTGAATASLGFPTMCNGANLAFAKSAFLEVHGYEGNFSVPSGDDEFLLRKIDLRFQGGIRFLSKPEAVVTTRPLDSRKSFFEQRIRWAGKWKYNTSQVSRLLAVFVLVVHASFLTIWVAPLIGLIDWRLAIFLVAGKMIFEFVFLFQVSSFLNVPWKILHFLALQFLYPIYVIYVGLSSFFKGYEWKGRRY